MQWSSISLYTFRLNERDHDRVDCVDGARGHHENEEEETIRQVEKASRQKERAHTAELLCHVKMGTPYFGDPGSPYSYENGDSGPYNHMNMGIPGPHIYMNMGTLS